MRINVLGTHCSLLEDLNATIGSTISDSALERLVQGCTRLRHLTLRADHHAPDLGLSSAALLAVGRCACGCLQTLDLGPLPQVSDGAARALCSCVALCKVVLDSSAVTDDTVLQLLVCCEASDASNIGSIFSQITADKCPQPVGRRNKNEM